MADQSEPGKAIRVEVDASSGASWGLLFLLAIVLTRGDPDLLDVMQEFCRRYMEGTTP